jgi:hypothetical protein
MEYPWEMGLMEIAFIPGPKQRVNEIVIRSIRINARQLMEVIKEMLLSHRVYTISSSSIFRISWNACRLPANM